MKIKTFLSLVTLLTLFDHSASAQYQMDGITYQPSLQNKNFIKYGGLQSHDLNTGTVFTRIPLYTYSDRDFSIPISADYASTGNTPNQQTSFLGAGWFLNAGGCIIREVRGVPDNDTKGFLSAHLSNTVPDWYALLADNRNESAYPYTTFPDETETESDIYHFRFLDYSGSFMLDCNQAVRVYNSSHPQGEYKIDFSQLMLSNTIIITTGDGTKYSFGGRFQDELDLVVENDSSLRPQLFNLTWLLKRIETPNGRVITFAYSTALDNDVYQPISCYSAKGTTRNIPQWTDEYSIPPHQNEFRMVRYSQYDLNLIGINIDGKVTVEFKYGAKIAAERRSSPIDGTTANMRNKSGNLHSIEIKDITKQTVIKNITLDYTLNTKGNPVTFLSYIQFPDNAVYTFDYYSTSTANFPLHGTTQIDHWGYSNSLTASSVPTLLPTLTCDANNIEHVGSTSREPNFEAARCGMLQKITYPTKGYTVFEYEGHSYTQKVDRNNLTDGLPALMAKNVGGYPYNADTAYPAGGVRLKKMTNYSTTDESVATEYMYTDKGGGNSGILLHYPRYIQGVVTKHDSLNIPVYRKIAKREASNFDNAYVDRNQIEYSTVLEKKADNSFIEYKFTDYKTTPAQLHIIVSSKITANNDQLSVISPNALYQYDIKPASNSHLRGKLAQTILHNSNGVGVRKYVYHYSNLDQLLHHPALHRSFEKIYFINENPNDRYLTEKSQIDYFGSDSIVRKLQYRYNNSGRLISQKKNNSRNIESVVYYADSVSTSPFHNISKETTNWNHLITNKINYPIGVLTYSNGKVIQGRIYYYATLTNKLGQTYCVVSKICTLNITGVSPIAISENSFELESRNDLFGSEGQLLQRTGTNGRVDSYIWGYAGTYIIAEVSGASFDTVQQILGANRFVNGIYTDPVLSNDAENALRYNIPNVLVKTYTYAPFIGITSVSDYNGEKTTIEYDASGRPLKIRDSKGAIMEEYEYNFSQK